MVLYSELEVLYDCPATTLMLINSGHHYHLVSLHLDIQ